ncbi:MAG: ABC transporter permease [Dorea sp.]|nr:ABC transporter permease [Dorea sp.]
MKSYIGKRLLQSCLVLILLSFFGFAVVYFAPGDISSLYIQPTMSEEQIEAVREKYNLNKSLGEQYVEWAVDVLHGNFGVSMVSHLKVKNEILEKLPSTMLLMGSSLILSVLIAIPLGMLAGYYQNRLPDNLIGGLSYVGMSIPQFWLGFILILLFSLKLHLLPTSGMHTLGVKSVWDVCKHMVLPCLTLSISIMPPYIRYVRANTIRELKEEYVVTAQARGTADKKILRKHVLKNTLLPVITLVGMNLSSVVGGSFIIETVFGWPGVGTYAMTAIKNRDYPAIMAYTMLIGAVLVAGNLIADLLYAVVDPRIRQGMDTVDEK